MPGLFVVVLLSKERMGLDVYFRADGSPDRGIGVPDRGFAVFWIILL